MTTTARPAGAEDCENCLGRGHELEIVEEIEDPVTGEVTEGTERGADCDCCDGRGWFAPETPAERRARIARETAERAEHALAAHLARWEARGLTHNRGDYPWVCPTARGLPCP